MLYCICIFILGIILGGLAVIFVIGATAKNKKMEEYEEGYRDGYQAGKEANI